MCIYKYIYIYIHIHIYYRKDTHYSSATLSTVGEVSYVYDPWWFN